MWGLGQEILVREVGGGGMEKFGDAIEMSIGELGFVYNSAVAEVRAIDGTEYRTTSTKPSRHTYSYPDRCLSIVIWLLET